MSIARREAVVQGERGREQKQCKDGVYIALRIEQLAATHGEIARFRAQRTHHPYNSKKRRTRRTRVSVLDALLLTLTRPDTGVFIRRAETVRDK